MADETLTPHPRFGVLTLDLGTDSPHRRGWVVYDTLTGCITNGVYFVRDLAFANATNANARGEDVEDMTPAPVAMDVQYPKMPKRRLVAHARRD